ncbi:transcription factor IIS helical bundle-like domain-containing protein [Aliikangiella sp. G2MR2-5]|uniref:transcription factor IIS helical bundle-like domain-containing protein n=1 Tax=Aliikangiella sp. G2MR2-5 TaxID=2788943 RepID=UPI0018ABB315|nr:transcription factor IIS helical bundle-like domain-containing protein [Aliikangiella sp. G2MR2-5]
MTRARESIIDLEATPYYHCTARCVRRAFLCGEDKYSGRNYEHRRDWIVERIAYQVKSFAIEVCSYAIMSNHYHLVLRVNVAQAREWSEANIIKRWKRLYQIPEVVKQYQKNPQSEGIAQVAQDIIEEWRNRLMDISWFMRGLNEYLAREANKEDNCKGRFWEGRFKSQPLLDEGAVVTAMSYVDLNPIRAEMAKTAEQSDYTSIQQRIKQSLNSNHTLPVPLIELTQSEQRHKNAIHFTEADYLELVDWLGRAILPGKRGYIDEATPPILNRLNLQSDEFINLMKRKDDLSGLTAIGSPSVLTHYFEKLGYRRVRGKAIAQKVFT